MNVAERKSLIRSITRDTVMLTVGLLLIINEAVIRSGPERPYLLILFGGMVGLPSVLGADFRRKNGNGKGDGGET